MVPVGSSQIVDRLEVFGQGVAGPPQSLHVHLDDPFLPQVTGDDPAPLRRVEFRPGEVVDEVSFRRDPAPREADQEPTVLVLGQRRDRPVGVDALRHIVDAPEVPPPAHGDPTVVPQQIERALVLLRAPRKSVRLLRAFGRLRLEVGALQRPLRAQPPQHSPLRRRRGRVFVPPCASRPARGRESSHAPPPEREMGDGQDRGFVSPVLVRETISIHPPIHFRAVVRAEPAPEGQIVGPVHDVHTVELEGARPFQVVDEGRGAERSRPTGPAEPLAVQPQSGCCLPSELRTAPAGPGHLRLGRGSGSRPASGSTSRSLPTGMHQRAPLPSNTRMDATGTPLAVTEAQTRTGCCRCSGAAPASGPGNGRCRR